MKLLMQKWHKAWYVCTFVCYFFIGAMNACAQEPNINDSKSIPYKSDKLQEASGASFMGFLVVTGGLLVLWLFINRKRKISLAHFFSTYENKHIKIIEKTRMSSTCTLYLVQYEDVNILLAQSGDRIVVINERGTPKSKAA